MKKEKGYNPENDVKWLLNESRPQKAEKLERRLVEYILAGKNAVEKEERVMEIMTVSHSLVEHLLADNNTDEDEKEERVREIVRFFDSLRQKFVAAFFDRQQLDVLLQAYGHAIEHMVREIEKGVVAAGEKWGKEPRHMIPEKLRSQERWWFCLDFLQYAGESLDRSMTLALFLLEKFRRPFQQWATNISGNPQEIDLKAHGEMANAYTLMWRACAEVHDDQEAEKFTWWFKKLLSHVEDNPNVEEVLSAVVDTLTSASEKDEAIREAISEAGQNPSVQETNPKDRPISFLALLRVGVTPDPQQQFTPGISLRSEARKLFERWQENRVEERGQRTIKGERILNWFSRDPEFTERILDERRSDILDNAKRGLRTDGIDHFDVNVAPLRNAGVRSIIFHPEKYSDPDLIEVKVVVKKETPHCLIFFGKLDHLHLELTPSALDLGQHSDIDLLHELLEFIVIDILHRIMVQERELRPTTPKTRGTTNLPKTIPVRPMVRRLPAGYKPSLDAIFRAQEARVAVPSGYTFVRAYWRSGALAYDLPTEPIGVYSDDDLFEAGGGQ